MAGPQRLIIDQFTVYLAAVGSAFPNVDTEPPADTWAVLGSGGVKSQGEDGLTVTHSQELIEPRTQGTTGPAAVSRTLEDFMAGFALHDFTAEGIQAALNGNPISTTPASAGVPGTKALNIHRGRAVKTYACLIRGKWSPYGVSFNTQYEVPEVYVSSSPAPVFSKSGMTGIQMELKALENETAASPFGRLVMQTHAAA